MTEVLNHCICCTYYLINFIQNRVAHVLTIHSFLPLPSFSEEAYVRCVNFFHSPFLFLLIYHLTSIRLLEDTTSYLTPLMLTPRPFSHSMFLFVLIIKIMHMSLKAKAKYYKICVMGLDLLHKTWVQEITLHLVLLNQVKSGYESYLVMVDGNAVCLFFSPSQTECVKAMMLGIQLPSHPMARITPVTIWGGACSIQSMGLVHNKKPRTSTLSPIVLSFSTSFNSKHQLLNGIPLSGLHPQTVLGERLSPRGLTAPVRGPESQALLPLTPSSWSNKSISCTFKIHLQPNHFYHYSLSHFSSPGPLLSLFIWSLCFHPRPLL